MYNTGIFKFSVWLDWVGSNTDPTLQDLIQSIVETREVSKTKMKSIN
jgi:hypothetical protein